MLGFRHFPSLTTRDRICKFLYSMWSQHGHWCLSVAGISPLMVAFLFWWLYVYRYLSKRKLNSALLNRLVLLFILLLICICKGFNIWDGLNSQMQNCDAMLQYWRANCSEGLAITLTSCQLNFALGFNVDYQVKGKFVPQACNICSNLSCISNLF